jgi:hypothetical protein
MFGGTPTMFTLEELSQRIAACNSGSSTISEFADWFEDNCNGAYEIDTLRDATVAIDAALSEYRYDGIGETVLKEELATAVRPFVLSESRVVAIGAPKRANVLALAAFSAAAAIAAPLLPTGSSTLAGTSVLNGQGASAMAASTNLSTPAIAAAELVVQ